MSQSALAKAIGLSHQQIQKYEGAGNRVSAAILVEVASALAVNPGYFLDDAPGANGSPPATDGWAEAQRILSTTTGSLDILRYFERMEPAVRLIGTGVFAVMSGSLDAN